MKGLNSISDFFNRHKVTAAVLGGFLSVTFGATWWLAQGGAVAFLTSVRALSTPEIATTLHGLPDYHTRVESGLERLEEQQAALAQTVLQIADSLDSFRAATEAVVEWAPSHSQRLTDAVGGCMAGDEDCPVYFRGRRTPAGAGCTLTTRTPRITLADGQEFPLRFADGYVPEPLSTEFQTVEMRLNIPDFIPPGMAGVVVLSVYAECPFSRTGETLARETFRLMVEILPRPE